MLRWLRGSLGLRFAPTLGLMLGLSAPAAATPPLDTALLSRFPVGAMPGSAEVLAELTALSERGGPEHEPLLRSIAEHEGGVVRARALWALGEIDARARRAARADEGAAPAQPDRPRHDGVVAAGGGAVGSVKDGVIEVILGD